MTVDWLDVCLLWRNWLVGCLVGVVWFGWLIDSWFNVTFALLADWLVHWLIGKLLVGWLCVIWVLFGWWVAGYGVFERIADVDWLLFDSYVWICVFRLIDWSVGCWLVDVLVVSRIWVLERSVCWLLVAWMIGRLVTLVNHWLFVWYNWYMIWSVIWFAVHYLVAHFILGVIDRLDGWCLLMYWLCVGNWWIGLPVVVSV